MVVMTSKLAKPHKSNLMKVPKKNKLVLLIEVTGDQTFVVSHPQRCLSPCQDLYQELKIVIRIVKFTFNIPYFKDGIN